MNDPEWGIDYGVVLAPSTFTVDHELKPVLYLPDGRVLVKAPAGFKTTPVKGARS